LTARVYCRDRRYKRQEQNDITYISS
jgi:hypothetical protein